MINKFKEKIRTILWFLKRPNYIPQIFQVIKRKKNKFLEDTLIESTVWCESVAVSKEEAYQTLISSEENEELEVLFDSEMKIATAKEKACPLKMGGRGAISFIYHLVKSLKAKNIIESGVAYGWSSMAILLAIKDHDGAKLISNDMPYIKMDNDDFVGCVISEKLKDKWVLQREPDVIGIPKAIKKLGGTIDVFHYDSDKSYTGRMWSSPIIWNSLKEGGFFISDDINDNIAFKHFAEKVNRVPIVIKHDSKYVGVLVK